MTTYRDSDPEVKEYVPIMVRLPKALHSELKEQAKSERRSLNAQVIFRLLDGCEEKEATQTNAQPHS